MVVPCERSCNLLEFGYRYFIRNAVTFDDSNRVLQEFVSVLYTLVFDKQGVGSGWYV